MVLCMVFAAIWGGWLVRNLWEMLRAALPRYAVWLPWWSRWSLGAVV